MEPYRLDKSAFKIQSIHEADHNEVYWLRQSPAERLKAAWYITCLAYGHSIENPPRMDKTKFELRHRIL